MESILVKSLRRLKKEIKYYSHRELRTKSDDLLEKDGDVEIVRQCGLQFLAILQEACHCKSPRLTEVALDIIHFFIEHGYLKGAAQTAGECVVFDRAAMGTLLETVCNASDEFDDAVHLQVIKVLLTAITSTYCEVHDASLLLSVRACFHIHLMSKTAAIKVAAKAALTQMTSIVYQRMESHSNNSNGNGASNGNAPGPVEEVQGSGPADPPSPPTLLSKGLAEELESAMQTATVELNAPTALSDFPSAFHRDAYLLFRALCKLSMKGLGDEPHGGGTGAGVVTSSDHIVVQNKLLSLELLHHLL
eukprot:gene31816-38468_t